MATPRTPLLADDQRSTSTQSVDETPHLNGLYTTSPSRPFATSLHPTLTLRTLSLVLSLPSFIIFAVHGPRYASATTFLSFAIARQLFVLGGHFGSQIIVVKIEVVHHRFKGVSAKAQEKWIKRSVAASVDVVILIGLLVSLSITASAQGKHGWPLTGFKAAVALGFIVFALLMISIPDFGNPNAVTLDLAIEKPSEGLVKLATSVLFGEDDDRGGEENSV